MNNTMERYLIEEILNGIKFDENYIEATFQYKLLLKLAKIFDEDTIFPERNIKKYGLEPNNFLKKEIDIVIEADDNKNIAIELKMPMNGQHPEQMYKFVEDIKFLEELQETEKFSQCLFIVVTSDKGFWEGTKSDGIYSFFRKNGKELEGKINKPTGKNENIYCELSGKYSIEWKEIEKSEFRYFIINIKK